MKASEFRIGNIVFDSIGNEFMKITGLSDTRIEADFIAGPSDERNERFAKGGKFQIAHIPLTPEILEKCNCRKEDESYFNEAGDKIHQSDSFYFKFDRAKVHVRYLYHTNELICWIRYEMKDQVSYYSNELHFYDTQHLFRRKEIYLHEFQNIIFALTGEELEVKL